MTSTSAMIAVTAADWAAVRDLFGRYCWLCDLGHGEAWADLWTEDGCAVGYSPAPISGRAALAQIPIVSAERFNGRLRHVISNLSCEYREQTDSILTRFYNHTTLWADTATSDVSMALCEAILERHGHGWRVRRLEARAQQSQQSQSQTDSMVQLLAVQEIEKLKARYFLFLDTKDAQGYGSLFGDGGSLDLREFDLNGIAAGRVEPGPILTGGEAISAFVLGALQGIQTAHRGFNPVIEVDSAREARATWGMEDWAKHSDNTLKLIGYGWYFDHYVRTERGWQIASSKLRRWSTNL